jgi:hypothetical protein
MTWLLVFTPATGATMSGKGELIKYTRLVAKTAQERAVLKQQIDAIIDAASNAITVEAMVETPPQGSRTKPG